MRRGPDWKWNDQDGGAAGVGLVVGDLSDDGWVRVEWLGAGTANSYRMGNNSHYDLEITMPPSGGHKAQAQAATDTPSRWLCIHLLSAALLCNSLLLLCARMCLSGASRSSGSSLATCSRAPFPFATASPGRSYGIRRAHNTHRIPPLSRVRKRRLDRRRARICSLSSPQVILITAYSYLSSYHIPIQYIATRREYSDLHEYECLYVHALCTSNRLSLPVVGYRAAIPSQTRRTRRYRTRPLWAPTRSSTTCCR